MNSTIEPVSFSVPLTLTAHSKAQQFRQRQSNLPKAKQVYLNTLAVYAVNVYLQWRGFETDLNNSDSWDPVMQTLMDVADLVVQNHGKIECLPLLPDADVLRIPEEVRTDRIAYVAVQLERSLQKATLLGFRENAIPGELPLNELRSLDQFVSHIQTFKKQQGIREWICLSEWFDAAIDAGWETVESLFEIPPAQLGYSFRQASSTEVKRGKLLQLEQLDRQIALFVGVTPTETTEIDISVEVYSLENRETLPENLRLIVMDEMGEIAMQAEAGSSESLEFHLSGEPGERFSVKVVLGNFSVTETFII